MKKVKAFVIACALFLVFLVFMHFACMALVPENNREFGYWISYNKDASYEAVSKNITEKTAVYMGSSEFHHGLWHKYNPSNLFLNSDVDLMCIGGAFNQSLSHAITMGAIGDEMTNKKAALILSPTWFYAADDRRTSKFYLRYSKSLYDAMMRNEKLTEETKQQIAERVGKVMNGGNQDIHIKDFDRLRYVIQGEKDRNKCAIMWLTYGIKSAFEGDNILDDSDKITAGKMPGEASDSECNNGEHCDSRGGVRKGTNCEKLDFKALRLEAEACSSGRCTNDFNMKDSVYNKKFAGKIDSLKGKNRHKSFDGSTEYEDLQLFIDVCREQGIDVLLILQPMNGKWYDYTGVTAEKRQELYENIRRIAEYNQVELADFSGEEYTENFFEDAVHPTEKGWVMINEKAYEFFEK